MKHWKLRFSAILPVAVLVACAHSVGAEELGESRPVRINPNEAVRQAKENLTSERNAARDQALAERNEARQARQALIEEMRSEAYGQSRSGFQPKFRFALGAGVMFPSGFLQRQVGAERGDRLDLRGDLDIGRTVAELDVWASAQLSSYGGVSLEFRTHAMSGSGTLSTQTTYHGVTYPEGARLESRLVDLLGGGWVYYKAFTFPEGHLLIELGSLYLHQLARIRRDGAPGKVVESLDAFFPGVGVEGEYDLGKGFTLMPALRIGGLAFDEGSYRQRNSMVAARVAIRAELADWVSCFAGWSLFALNATRTDDGEIEDARLLFNDLHAGLSIRF